jgi:predicted nucleic acid-binding protein
MRVALDSNLLVYAELEPESDMGRRAADMILRAASDGVVAVQALGEFLRVIQRRAPLALPGAVAQADLYRAIFLTPATTPDTIVRAGTIARDHHLQVWDAVICTASADAGARFLLTEDLQDRRLLNGLRLLNPFDPANAAEVEAALIR